jgi:hypothetical protein
MEIDVIRWRDCTPKQTRELPSFGQIARVSISMPTMRPRSPSGIDWSHMAYEPVRSSCRGRRDDAERECDDQCGDMSKPAIASRCSDAAMTTSRPRRCARRPTTRQCLERRCRRRRGTAQTEEPASVTGGCEEREPVSRPRDQHHDRVDRAAAEQCERDCEREDVDGMRDRDGEVTRDDAGCESPLASGRGSLDAVEHPRQPVAQAAT